jgi:hypothetical protein
VDIQRVREIVKGIAQSENGPQLLRENPRALAETLNLKPQELVAIFSGDLQLIHNSRNPLAGTTSFTFVTGSTITGGRTRLVHLGANSTTTFTFLTGSTITAVIGPTRLEDLSRPELIRVLSRALEDPDFAERLRRFLS